MLTRIRPRRVAELFRRDLGGPLDVVNLITTARFERYRWYGLLVLPVMTAVGGRVIWMGRFDRSVAGEPQAERLLIVRYPSHRHFLAMTLNPYYVAINRLREAGVRRFEASFTRVSHCDPGLARRRLLVAVHYETADPNGEGAVEALAGDVLGELVYATRTVAALDFLDPPRDTDPNPLRLGRIAMFAPADDELPEERLGELAGRLAEVTDDCAVQVYRREPRSAYRPSLIPAPRAARATAG